MSSQQLVSYTAEGDVAVLALDDGKANALSPDMLAAIGAALDRAQAEARAVVILGREGILSGGFDLKVLRGGGRRALGMLRGGFELAARLLAFPLPVVIGCTGHAIAMGAFLVLSGDVRLGVRGDFRYQANEVAIGLTVPRAALAICRHRLTPSHFQRATVLSEPFAPTEALAGGFIDRLVDVGELREEALTVARGLCELDAEAHARTRLRARKSTLRAIRRGLSADLVEITATAVKGMVQKQLGRQRACGGGVRIWRRVLLLSMLLATGCGPTQSSAPPTHEVQSEARYELADSLEEAPGPCSPCGPITLVHFAGDPGLPVDAAYIDGLASQMRALYGLDVTVGPPLALPSAAWNRERQQYDGTALLGHVVSAHAGARDEGRTVIALMSADIYLSIEPAWRWAFGTRQTPEAGGWGVISAHRMAGPPARRRMLVMLGKYIGGLACGFAMSEDPASIMYSRILSPDDLDEMGAVVCHPDSP